MEEDISFWGHPNIRSLHYTTLEITREPNLTPRGDCIVGVAASKGCLQIDPLIRKNLLLENNFVKISIIVEPYSFVVVGKTNSKLLLSHPNEIVLRKSSYVDSRTLLINCDVSSADVPRNMIDALRDSTKRGMMRIVVE